MRTDRRVTRTQSALYRSLVELSTIVGFDHVTVADITERAGVNRTTFYRHHHDKHAFVRALFRAGADPAMLRIGPVRGAWDGLHERLVAGLTGLFEHLDDHRPLFRALLAERRSAWFHGFLLDFFQELTDRQLGGEPGSRRGAVAALTAHAAVGAVAWWLTAAGDAGPEDMAEWCAAYLCGGVPALLRPVPVNIP